MAVSVLGCGGWVEEGPGIRASACSFSVLSSVEEMERKHNQIRVAFNFACSKHIICKPVFALLPFKWALYYAKHNFPTGSHVIIAFQRVGYLFI